VLAVVLLAVCQWWQYADANSCTSWYNCASGSCAIGKWQDTTIASIGRWASFNDNCNKAIDIMQKHPGVTSTDRGIIHTSLQYLCCYGSGQYNLYVSIIDSLSWHSVNVTYGRAVCNSDEGDQNHNSLIVLLDEPSQKAMGDLVKSFEAAMIAHGLPVNRTRAVQEPFHTTLGVVAKGYPVDEVLAEINAAIPNFSPIPINIKNFLLMPAPLWEFHSSDSQAAGTRSGSGHVSIASHIDLNDDVAYGHRLVSVLSQRRAAATTAAGGSPPRGAFSPVATRALRDRA